MLPKFHNVSIWSSFSIQIILFSWLDYISTLCRCVTFHIKFDSLWSKLSNTQNNFDVLLVYRTNLRSVWFFVRHVDWKLVLHHWLLSIVSKFHYCYDLYTELHIFCTAHDVWIPCLFPGWYGSFTCWYGLDGVNVYIQVVLWAFFQAQRKKE